jgi:tetratricopeptide (TPR) repeat protein
MCIGFSKILMGEHENGLKMLQEVLEDEETQKLIQLQLESKARLGLAYYFKGDTQKALTILEEVTDQSKAYGLAGAGTAYAYVRAHDALSKYEPKVAREMAEIIMQKAKQEESPWLEWHALEIMIAADQLEEKSSREYQNQKQNIIRNLNQSKPQKLDLSLDPNSPPFFVLV